MNLLMAKSQGFFDDHGNEPTTSFFAIGRPQGGGRENAAFKAPFIRRVGIVSEAVLEIRGRAPQEKFVGIAEEV